MYKCFYCEEKFSPLINDTEKHYIPYIEKKKFFHKKCYLKFKKEFEQKIKVAKDTPIEYEEWDALPEKEYREKHPLVYEGLDALNYRLDSAYIKITLEKEGETYILTFLGVEDEVNLEVYLDEEEINVLKEQLKKIKAKEIWDNVHEEGKKGNIEVKKQIESIKEDISENVNIPKEELFGERFTEWTPPTFTKLTGTLYETKWGWRVSHPDNLTLGEFVDIGTFTYINAGEGVIIEDNVQIGSHCSIYSIDTEREVRSTIKIKEGVKVGAHSVILPKKDKIHVIDKNIKAGSVVY